MEELVKYSPIIAMALTIYGWWVVNDASKQLKIREERRKEVDACCVMAANILEKAREYYTCPSYTNKAKKLESELVFEIYRLYRRSALLETRSPKFQLEGVLVEMDESITGGTFKSVNRMKVDIDSECIAEIEHRVHAVMDALETGFDDSFH